VPHPRFAGKSGCGVRGDVIQELDDTVGQVLKTLERLKLAENTLVIFSSDNGPVIDDGYADGAVENLHGHTPAGALKGAKYSLYEAGTRVPFIARWPGRIKPGTSDALVCQIDFLASFAHLTGQKLPTDAAPDSFDVLPALLGETRQGRETLIEHANGLAIRKGTWKYIPPRNPAGKAAKAKVAGKGELYDLAMDLGETNNLISDQPEMAQSLSKLLAEAQAKPGTRP
jgi:arylsulfatase A-like enzyme